MVIYTNGGPTVRDKMLKQQVKWKFWIRGCLLTNAGQPFEKTEQRAEEGVPPVAEAQEQATESTAEGWRVERVEPLAEALERAEKTRAASIEAQKEVARAYRGNEQQVDIAYAQAEHQANTFCNEAIERALKAREQAEQQAEKAHKEAIDQAKKAYEDSVRQALRARQQTIEEAWQVRGGAVERAWKLFARETMVIPYFGIFRIARVFRLMCLDRIAGGVKAAQMVKAVRATKVSKWVKTGKVSLVVHETGDLLRTIKSRLMR